MVSGDAGRLSLGLTIHSTFIWLVVRFSRVRIHSTFSRVGGKACSVLLVVYAAVHGLVANGIARHRVGRL